MNLSTQLSLFAVNGTTTLQWGGVYLSGTDPFLNVFHVSGTDLSSANNVQINVPNGSVVLVNIDGTNVSWSGGLTVSGTSVSNVLYNFYQATSLTIQGIDIRGSILAPFADVNFVSGVINGQMIAKNFGGAGQFNTGQMNNALFIGNIPCETTLVNIAEITYSDQHDPDSTPGNGIPTEDDYAKVIIDVGGTGSGGGGGGGNGGGNDNWEYVGNIGPGIIVWTLINDNQGNILAGTWGGVIYCSTDDGSTWTKINNDMTVGFIWALAVNSSGYLFAGTEQGLYRSTNNGASWSLAGLAGMDVRAIVIDGFGNIYAGTWGAGVFKSTDNGASFNPVNTGLTSLAVHGMVINSANEIFAATFGAGVSKSSDLGASWTHLNVGYDFVWALGITSDDVLFAGTYGAGVFRSFNHGTNWSNVNVGLSAQFIYAITVDAGDNVFVSSWAGGVFVSSDKGDTWNSLGLGGFGVSSLLVNPNSSALYAGTSDGAIYKNTSVVTAVEEELEIPTEFNLNQNYPNPFNPATTIRFAIPEAGSYQLKVYNILGEEVRTLINEELNPGYHEVDFRASSLASGIYIYQLLGDKVNITKKMMLMK